MLQFQHGTACEGQKAEQEKEVAQDIAALDTYTLPSHPLTMKPYPRLDTFPSVADPLPPTPAPTPKSAQNN
eukprot:6309069-Amphidinium_carterae.2